MLLDLGDPDSLRRTGSPLAKTLQREPDDF
jgi:hypothetical protein